VVRRQIAAVVAAAVVFGVAAGAGAVPTAAGDPDPGWLGGDVAVVGPDASVSDVVIDGAGRILICGTIGRDVLVARFTDVGEPDPTFAGGDIVAVDLGGWDVGMGCAVRPDGRIEVAAVVGGTGAVVRMGDDGELDPAFGDGGVVPLAGRGIDVFPDGDGTLVATSRQDIAGASAALLRLDAAGDPDLAYGVDGVAAVPDPPSAGGSVWLSAAARAPDGSVVLAIDGVAGSWIARVAEGDVLEFAPGVVVAELGMQSVVDVAVDAMGRVLAIGSGSGTTHVVRLTAAGTPDGTFLAPTLPGEWWGVAAAADGTAYVVGTVPATSGDGSDASIARLVPTGGLDPTFGIGGYVRDDIDRYDGLQAVAVDAQQRPVAAGQLHEAQWLDGWAFVVRYLPTSPPPPTPTPPAPIAGYWMLSEIGDVYAFGTVPHLIDWRVPAPIVDIEPSASGRGYWLLNANGVVVRSGDAADLRVVKFPDLAAGERAAALSATPSGTGLWIFTTWGRVITIGDAPHLGDMAGTPLNGPVLDGAVTPTGQGYWMVGSDGGIFAFGDARFFGSMGGERLNQPVQSLVPTASGHGYWLVASDGGIFAFGDAPFRGSMGAVPLNRPVTGMVRFGDGYLMVGADGGIFNFSSEPFLGSLGDHPPASPIVAVAGHV
jgi:uncharacterized delta-60 repeat protein